MSGKVAGSPLVHGPPGADDPGVHPASMTQYGRTAWPAEISARNAADCPAIDAWRESLITGGTVARPAPQQDCPATFGNSDIFGGTYADPTP